MSTRNAVPRNPARLIVALAIAGVLAVFLLYTAVAGHSTPTLAPNQLAGQSGSMSVVGKVIGPVSGDSHSAQGLRFGLQNRDGRGVVVPVVYRGENPPPLFKVGREVVISGTYAGGHISGSSLVTKCPSKYQPSKP